MRPGPGVISASVSWPRRRSSAVVGHRRLDLLALGRRRPRQPAGRALHLAEVGLVLGDTVGAQRHLGRHLQHRLLAVGVVVRGARGQVGLDLGRQQVDRGVVVLAGRDAIRSHASNGFSHADRRAHVREGAAAERDTVLEREAERHDDEVAHARRVGAERDARRARLHRGELRPGARGSLGEDGHCAALGQHVVAGGERRAVAGAGVAGVDRLVHGPVHGDEAGEGQEGPGQGQLPQGRLRNEAGQAPERVESATTGSTSPLKWLMTMSTGPPSGNRVQSLDRHLSEVAPHDDTGGGGDEVVHTGPRRALAVGDCESTAWADTSASTAVATCHTPWNWKMLSSSHTGELVRPSTNARPANTAMATNGRSDHAGRVPHADPADHERDAAPPPPAPPPRRSWRRAR